MIYPRLAPNRESKISKFSFEAYAVLEANTTQGPSSNPKLPKKICFCLIMVLPFTSATEQASGSKDTTQSLARCQYQEGGLVQRDVSAPFRKRTKQQQRQRSTSLDAKQRGSLSQLIQLVRTTDLPADQDPGHRRCGAPIYHHFCVSLSFRLCPVRAVGLTTD